MTEKCKCAKESAFGFAGMRQIQDNVEWMQRQKDTLKEKFDERAAKGLIKGSIESTIGRMDEVSRYCDIDTDEVKASLTAAGHSIDSGDYKTAEGHVAEAGLQFSLLLIRCAGEKE